jgi:tRNA uridine 5-carboxymethylaminomethyl modification enzyme
MVDDARWERFETRRARYEWNRSVLDRTPVRCPEKGAMIPAAQFLRRPGASLEDLVASGLGLDLANSGGLDIAALESAVKFEGYIKREEASAFRRSRAEGRRIPLNFRYHGLPGLAREAVERLADVRPETLGQASRIPGITPAAIAILEFHLR